MDFEVKKKNDFFFEVVGRWKYRFRKSVPEFTSERDEGMKMLVNSCIRELDRKGVRVSRKSGAARPPEVGRHFFFFFFFLCLSPCAPVGFVALGGVQATPVSGAGESFYSGTYRCPCHTPTHLYCSATRARAIQGGMLVTLSHTANDTNFKVALVGFEPTHGHQSDPTLTTLSSRPPPPYVYYSLLPGHNVPGTHRKVALPH